MLRDLAAAQALLVGGMLLAAAVLKARDIARGEISQGTALYALVGERFAKPAWWGLVFIESVVSGLLLTGAAATIASILATLVLVGAAVFLALSRNWRPDTSCGCFGSDSDHPITTRMIVRAGALALLAIAPAVAGGRPWFNAVGNVFVAVVLVAEMSLLLAVTPELRPRRDPKPEWARQRSLRSAVRTVEQSASFQSLRPQLSSVIPTDVWAEPDNKQRVVLFNLHGDEPGTQRFLAFAVALTHNQVLRVGELRLAATVDGWRASHHDPRTHKATQASTSSRHSDSPRRSGPANSALSTAGQPNSVRPHARDRP